MLATPSLFPGQMRNYQLFATDGDNGVVGKALRLDEFEVLQSQAKAKVEKHLKTDWADALYDGVVSTLGTISKGWFNLNLRKGDQEVYKISKLRRFMTMVKFVMQDSLLFMLKDSLQRYRDVMVGATPLGVTVVDPSTVEVLYRDEAQARIPPMFSASIVIRDDHFACSTTPQVCCRGLCVFVCVCCECACVRACLRILQFFWLV